MHFLGYAIAIMAIVGTMGLAKAQDPDTLLLSEIVKPNVQPWYLPEGAMLNLTCELQLGKLERGVRGNAVWEKGGRRIDSSAGNGIFIATRIEAGLLTSTLEKEAATKEDGNSYLCYPDGGTRSQGYNIMVNVFTFEAVDAVLEKYGTSATLKCKVENLGSYQPMQWYRDGQKVVEDPEKYEISSANGTLTILKVMPEDIGEYQCKITLGNGQGFNQTVTLSSPPYVHTFEKSKNLVEGDPLELECEAVGNPEPSLSWLKDGEPVDTSDPRLKLSDNKAGMANGTLRLEDLQFEDRAEYTCLAQNDYGSSNSTILVRVKDKLAALWPFLGICAEVAILVIIIFVYENRRSKKLEELDAREEADHLTNSHAHKGGDEVRQRK